MPGLPAHRSSRRRHSDTATALESVWRWLTGELQGQPLPPLLLVIGLDGGGLLEVLDARAPGTRVLALEPDPAAWHRTIGKHNVQAWRADGRLLYLAGPTYAGVDEAWRMFPAEPDAYRLIVDPRQAKGSAANLDAARVMKRIVFGVRANAEARRKFAPLYLTNVLRNLPAIATGRDIRALADGFSGVPAIVIAAGPSLDATIGQLATMKRRGLMIAADTALRPLLTAGIEPHLAIGVDPGHWNARHFDSLPECRNTWLVSESALAPSAASVFNDRTFWFRVGDHEPWPWLKDTGVDVGHLSVWGSVLTAAFQLACLAGCDPIVIVGADLAYTNGHPYGRGTTYEFDWAWNAATGTDLASSWHAKLTDRKARTVTDLHGNPTTSTASMMSFRDWMVARAAKSGRRVINATGAGIFFGAGVEQLPLSSALQQEVDLSSLHTFERSTTRWPLQEVANESSRVSAMVREGTLAQPPLAEWAAFSGEGFDAAAVAAAMDAAATGFALGPVTSPARPDIRLETAHRKFLPGTLVCLAESLTRLQAGLRGQTLPDAIATFVDPAQRAALLGESLELLLEIRSRAKLMNEITAIADVSGPADFIVSTSFGWPQDVRWAIQAFEALLGRAWSSKVPLPSLPLSEVQVVPEQDGAPAPILSHALLVLAEQWKRCVRGLEEAEASELLRAFTNRAVEIGLPTE